MAGNQVSDPNLPIAPDQWDRRFQDQYSNVLRLFFNQLADKFQQLLQPQGGQYIEYAVRGVSEYRNPNGSPDHQRLCSNVQRYYSV
jgi:hypothetical protein